MLRFMDYWRNGWSLVWRSGVSAGRWGVGPQQRPEQSPWESPPARVVGAVWSQVVEVTLVALKDLRDPQSRWGGGDGSQGAAQAEGWAFVAMTPAQKWCSCSESPALSPWATQTSTHAEGTGRTVWQPQL